MITPTLAIYLPDLSGGGAERLYVQLAPVLNKLGISTSFLLNENKGELAGALSSEIEVVSLNARRQLSALPKLVHFLRTVRPAALLVNMEHMNVMAIVARALANVPTKIVVVQHNALSEQVKRKSWQWKALPQLYRWVLPHADAIIAVSKGVASELSEMTAIIPSAIDVIYNGLVGADFDDKAQGEAGHPWFSEPEPIVLGMGRLVPQKDFETLIRAFATISARTDARLIILGDGPLRADLEWLIGDLGLVDRISLQGFVPNPLPWLRGASLFVLSSRFEGFGNVLVEALACGTPAISTNCPYGPAEILVKDNLLVPVGDPAAMGSAILSMLSKSPKSEELMARGNEFSVKRCAEEYRSLLLTVLGQSKERHRDHRHLSIGGSD